MGKGGGGGGGGWRGANKVYHRIGNVQMTNFFIQFL